MLAGDQPGNEQPVVDETEDDGFNGGNGEGEITLQVAAVRYWSLRHLVAAPSGRCAIWSLRHLVAAPSGTPVTRVRCRNDVPA